MLEIWKDIYGYEGYYQVSNTGKVRSIDRECNNGQGVFVRKGKELSQAINNKDGYMVVALYKNCKQKMMLVHRLIAIAFIENPNNYPIINHIDENKNNNSISNLEWCSYSYNNSYNGISKKKMIHKQKVVVMIKNGIEIKRFDSLMDSGRETGISRANIQKCCIGKRKSAGGFNWKYA